MPAIPLAALNVDLLIESLIYAGVSVLFLALVFVLFVKAMPFSVRKEIEVDQNTSLGIIMGCLILGLCYIIGRTFGG